MSAARLWVCLTSDCSGGRGDHFQRVSVHPTREAAEAALQAALEEDTSGWVLSEPLELDREHTPGRTQVWLEGGQWRGEVAELVGEQPVRILCDD